MTTPSNMIMLSDRGNKGVDQPSSCTYNKIDKNLPVQKNISNLFTNILCYYQQGF